MQHYNAYHLPLHLCVCDTCVSFAMHDIGPFDFFCHWTILLKHETSLLSDFKEHVSRAAFFYSGWKMENDSPKARGRGMISSFFPACLVTTTLQFVNWTQVKLRDCMTSKRQNVHNWECVFFVFTTPGRCQTIYAMFCNPLCKCMASKKNFKSNINSSSCFKK